MSRLAGSVGGGGPPRAGSAAPIPPSPSLPRSQSRSSHVPQSALNNEQSVSRREGEPNRSPTPSPPPHPPNQRPSPPLPAPLPSSNTYYQDQMFLYKISQYLHAPVTRGILDVDPASFVPLLEGLDSRLHAPLLTEARTGDYVKRLIERPGPALKLGKVVKPSAEKVFDFTKRVAELEADHAKNLQKVLAAYGPRSAKGKHDEN